MAAQHVDIFILLLIIILIYLLANQTDIFMTQYLQFSLVGGVAATNKKEHQYLFIRNAE